jgi:hypothetical protein
MVHQGISRRVLRGATYDPGHWTFYFVEGGGFGLVISVVVVPFMLAVLPYMQEVAGSTPGLDFSKFYYWCNIIKNGPLFGRLCVLHVEQVLWLVGKNVL